jgi:hypothetical protein
MPKAILNQELDQIAALVARHADGADLTTLMQVSSGQFTRRTLQRRLADLVACGRLIKTGEGRALKYRLAPHAEAHLTLPPLTVEATAETYVPLSPESVAIKAYVRQPRQNRQPVSYRLEFLEAYHPNQTFYLPESLRAQLHDLGRSPLDDAPAGTFARDILNRLLIDLSWASSRLEGNTYSRLDTERLIEFGQAASDKDAEETQMILNHKAAIEFLVHDADRAGFNPETIIALHALLSDGLLHNPQACGQLRRCPVEISGSVYLPIALPQRLEELFGIIVGMAAEIHDPFEQALFAMAHLPYLQPFVDVNKRVSRLAANIPLIQHNLCPLSFIDVPERAYVDAILGVYELNRIELLRDVFVWAYERSCQQYLAVRQQLAPPDPFRLRYRHALTEAVRAIVQGNHPVSEERVWRIMPVTVAETDREHFVTLVLSEFKTLHPDNAIRFGLRPLEFAAWLSQTSDGKK